jgi:mono/diheme cytochrome c family protein
MIHSFFQIMKHAPIYALFCMAVLFGSLARANAADPAVMEKGKIQFMMCAACHGKEGEGTAAAPPLAGSEWVMGPAENLIRIQLRGLRGPITVKGREYDIVGGMAPMAYQRDEQIAAVLTYVRQSFGNNASAVEPSQVAALRSEVGKPQLTVADLIMPEGMVAVSTAPAAPSNKYGNLDEGESFPRWAVIGIIVVLLAGLGLWLAKSK